MTSSTCDNNGNNASTQAFDESNFCGKLWWVFSLFLGYMFCLLSSSSLVQHSPGLQGQGTADHRCSRCHGSYGCNGSSHSLCPCSAQNQESNGVNLFNFLLFFFILLECPSLSLPPCGVSTAMCYRRLCLQLTGKSLHFVSGILLLPQSHRKFLQEAFF